MEVFIAKKKDASILGIGNTEEMAEAIKLRYWQLGGQADIEIEKFDVQVIIKDYASYDLSR